MPTATRSRPGGVITNTDYGTAGNVADADPRIISNLIADMTSNNPAAVQAFVDAGLGTARRERRPARPRRRRRFRPARC